MHAESMKTPENTSFRIRDISGMGMVDFTDTVTYEIIVNKIVDSLTIWVVILV